ncbi:MAG: hypothetical protein WCP65_04395, partial [Bacteroidota bacterium]
ANKLFIAENEFGKMIRKESLKIAYITKELNLTTAEAEKFWPVYNAYQAEIKKVKKDYLQNQDPLVMEEQILNIRKKYKDSFKKVLGSDERANKLFIAENEFGKMIRKEWQKRAERFKKAKDNNGAGREGNPPNNTAPGN